MRQNGNEKPVYQSRCLHVASADNVYPGQGDHLAYLAALCRAAERSAVNVTMHLRLLSARSSFPLLTKCLGRGIVPSLRPHCIMHRCAWPWKPMSGILVIVGQAYTASKQMASSAGDLRGKQSKHWPSEWSLAICDKMSLVYRTTLALHLWVAW